MIDGFDKIEFNSIWLYGILFLANNKTTIIKPDQSKITFKDYISLFYVGLTFVDEYSFLTVNKVRVYNIQVGCLQHTYQNQTRINILTQIKLI